MLLLTSVLFPEEDDDDVDGVPLDGAAFLKNATTTSKPAQRGAASNNLVDGGKKGGFTAAGFAPSKWESVDQETVQAQAVTSKWDIFDHQLEVS